MACSFFLLLISAKCHFLQEALLDHPNEVAALASVSVTCSPTTPVYYFFLRAVSLPDILSVFATVFSPLLPRLACKLLEARDSVLLTTVFSLACARYTGDLCHINDCI